MKNPLFWVPTSYVAMGAVYTLITTTLLVMFKNLGMSDADAAVYSSVPAFIYSFKFLWGPFIELFRPKKFYVVASQFSLAALLALLASMIEPKPPLLLAVGTLLVAAILSGTMDMASDGVYVTTLDNKNQQALVGVQGVSWNVGYLVANSLVVFVVGKIAGEASGQSHPSEAAYATAWMWGVLILTPLLMVVALWHSKVLPTGSSPAGNAGQALTTFGKAFVTFFQKKYILNLIAFAFFYRAGIGLLDKGSRLFFIAKKIASSREFSGLELDNTTLAILDAWGTIAVIVGSLLAPFVVRKLGMKRSTLLLLALCLNIPSFLFLYLGYERPTSLPLVCAMVFFQKLGFGIGAIGHMVYMMQQIAPGPYKTSHYAFATGLGLSLCTALTGLVTGLITDAAGYQWFFVIVLIAGAISLVATLFAPIRELSDAQFEAEANERWERMANAIGLGVTASAGSAFVAYFLVLVPTKSFVTSAYGALLGALLGLVLTLIFVKNEYSRVKIGAVLGFLGAAALAVGIRLLATGRV